MTTAPWSAAAETLIRESAQHVYSARFYTAAGVEIGGMQVTSCTVRMDEYWSPYLQATLTAVMPAAATLAQLDPRLVVRVDVSAGYVLPGGVVDSHLLGRGYLVRRTVNLPGHELVLEIGGPEYLYDAWRALMDSSWSINLNPARWDAGTEARDAVARCLIVAGAITGDQTGSSDPRWDYAGAMRTTGWAGPSPDVWAPGVGDPALSTARDIAGRIGGWFRCDELGIWRLTERPVDDDDAVIQHWLRVGVDGTILTSAATLSREGWANAVLCRYAWTAPAPAGQVYGWAFMETGPYAVGTVGMVVHTIDVPWKGAEVHAYNRATAALKQIVGMGFAYTVDAIAAYWLRPTHVVSLDLGAGPELAFVSAIAFDLVTGRMSITTRQPAPGTIKNTP